MPFVEVDGIRTRYDVLGGGPPILMYAPGGFNARLEQWTDLGIYKRIKLLDYLPSKYTCIIFDRRENGESGGAAPAMMTPTGKNTLCVLTRRPPPPPR